MNSKEIEKYDAAGVYTISIDDTLVYVGKSHNMLRRINEHIAAIQHPTAHKYQILHQAIQQGYNIQFDVLYYAKSKNPYTEILNVEAYYINKFMPPLNIQIPNKKDFRKYTINEKAKVITLSEVLKGEPAND